MYGSLTLLSLFDLQALLRGAQSDGRLIFQAPPPSHALLMTTNHGSFPFNKIRAIGAITDDAGKTSYFRSTPFPQPKILPELRGTPEPFSITLTCERSLFRP